MKAMTSRSNRSGNSQDDVKFESVESFLKRGGVIEVYNDHKKLIRIIDWTEDKGGIRPTP